MGTVKYTGPVASFHCPTNAEIRSLKVHFSPKQEGSGDPSPENVREIVGWDGVQVEQRGKNLFDASNPNIISPNCWVSSNAPNKITASNMDRTVYIKCLPNTTYSISKTLGNVLAAGYTTELPASGIQTYSYMRDNYAKQVIVTTGADAKYLAIWFYDSSKTFDRTVQPEDIYKTLQIEIGSTVTPYEPYHGSTTNYEFGVLGKNKLDKNSYKYLNSSIICFGGDSSSEPDGSLFLKAGTYTFSISTTVNMIFATDANKKNIVSATNTNTATFTLPESMAVRIGCFIQGATDEEMLSYDYQLELGSTATIYEPYNPNKTVYGGWVDLISGEVCEKWIKINIPVTQILGGQLNGYNRDISTERYFQISSPSLGTHQALLSNKAVSANCRNDNEQVRIGPDGTSLIHYALPNSALNIAVADTAEDRNSKIITWLNENPIEIVYNLKNPNTYNLPPYSSELKTFLSHNNVWSNADYVEVEYDLHETQNILARKQFIIANQPHVVKPAAVPLQSFVTDMAAPLKSCKVYFSPVQDTSNGAPSPDNICPISGWTGLEVYRTGKNLCDTPTSADITANWPIDGSSFSKTIYGLPTDRTFTLQANITKDLDENISNTRFYLNGKLISGRFFNTGTPTGIKSISNQPTDDGALKLSHNRLGLTSYGAEFNNIQLEFGSIATKYEPYTGTTIPITFPSEAGTIYGGYVDLVTGEVVRGAIKVTTNEIVSFHDITDRGNGVYEICLNLPIYARSERRTEAKCNCFAYGNTSTGIADRFDLTYVLNQKARQVRISHYFEEAPTIDIYKEYLQSIGFEIVYYIDQENYLIDPTTLKTLRGTNNIWASNGGDNIELSYWKH